MPPPPSLGEGASTPVRVQILATEHWSLLAPYFVTSRHDDEEGVLETLGPGARIRPSRVLSSTPVIIGLIDAVLAGVLAGLVAKVVDAGTAISILIGVAVGVAAVIVIVVAGMRGVTRARGLLAPRFPRAG